VSDIIAPSTWTALVADITGNLVVFGAHWLTGGFGQIGPLFSIPFFARLGQALNRWN
jgi:hypothetical protein